MHDQSIDNCRNLKEIERNLKYTFFFFNNFYYLIQKNVSQKLNFSVRIFTSKMIIFYVKICKYLKKIEFFWEWDRLQRIERLDQLQKKFTLEIVMGELKRHPKLPYLPSLPHTSSRKVENFLSFFSRYLYKKMSVLTNLMA